MPNAIGVVVVDDHNDYSGWWRNEHNFHEQFENKSTRTNKFFADLIILSSSAARLILFWSCVVLGVTKYGTGLVETTQTAIRRHSAVLACIHSTASMTTSALRRASVGREWMYPKPM